MGGVSLTREDIAMTKLDRKRVVVAWIESIQYANRRIS